MGSKNFIHKYNINGFVHKYSIYLVFLGLVVILTIATKGKFLDTTNILNVLRQISVIGLIAYGVTFIIITKGIDLSSGAVLALVSVVTASLLQTEKTIGTFIRYPNLPVLPIIIPVIAGLIVATIAGFSNGSLVVWGRIPPFIATLGMFTAARGLAFLYADGRPLSALNPSFNNIFGQGSLIGIPNPVWIFVIFGIISAIILSHTRLGRYVYAIGANTRAAYVSGIDTKKYTLFVYVYAGFLVGVASIVQTARIGSGQAGLGISYELFAIASAVIGGTSPNGGRGTIVGTFIGAMIFGCIKNGMDILNITAFTQQVVLGAIIITAVVLDQRKHAIRS